MGLFTKRPPCAICGGKVKGLLTWKVEGQMVCDTCFNHVDIPIDRVNHMTMSEFREYMAFRQENSQLKSQFQITQKVDLGAFEDKIVFDTVNGLFCMKDSLASTIFEKNCIKSFVIREDCTPLFEGSAAGLLCYTSTVPERAAALSPVLQQIRLAEERERRERERARQNGNDQYISSSYCPDIEEPFEKFVVEIQCEHPYYEVLTAEKQGPSISNSTLGIKWYLDEYQKNVEIMRQLARTLMEMAFPGAPEQRVGSGTVVGQTAAAPIASVDVVAEIQRFKELAEQGVLTEEEFAAKKRQLLGI